MLQINNLRFFCYDVVLNLGGVLGISEASEGGNSNFEPFDFEVDLGEGANQQPIDVGLNPAPELEGKSFTEMVSTLDERRAYDLPAYRQFCLVDETYNPEDQSVQIEVGIKKKQPESPIQSSAKATIKDGSMHIDHLPIRGDAAYHKDQYGHVAGDSKYHLMMLTDFARETGLEEVRITDPEKHPQTEELRQEFIERSRSKGRLEHIKDYIRNSPQALAESNVNAVYSDVEDMGYDYDHQQQAWIRTFRRDQE